MKVLQRHAWALARISMRPLKVAAVIVAIDATARPEGCDRSFDLPPISVGTTNLCRKGQNLSSNDYSVPRKDILDFISPYCLAEVASQTYLSALK